MKKRIYLLCILMCANLVFADVKPSIMLEKLSDSLLQQISSEKNLSENQSKVASIIKQVLIPKVDKVYMSMSVIGPKYWNQANNVEQQDFVHEFETMVTNNYARLFSNYTGQKVVFMPYRGDYNKKEKIEIKSQVMTEGNKNNFRVYYKLLKDKNGDWLIYDFSIDGISMVESYRSQFSPILSQKGLPGLISNMKEFNSKSQY